MADYHVGCGTFGIYAGTLRKSKKTKDTPEAQWLNKTDVTDQAIGAVAQYFLQEMEAGEKPARTFTYAPTGKKYTLSLSEENR